MLRLFGRILLLLLAALLTGVGAVGLGIAYAPDHALVSSAREILERGLALASGRVPGIESPFAALRAISGFPLRFVLAPAGLVLLVAIVLPGTRRFATSEGDEEGECGEDAFDEKALKRSRREAAAIAKKGNPHEAAELCFAVGLMDEAAGYFVTAREYVRAAEIRHDQNRFIESAELYTRAGSHDSAAVIYAQQDEHTRAAEAYVEAGNLSVAAEMFEAAGRHREAAECFEKAEFPRQAAKAYIKCQEWQRAASNFEEVMREVATNARTDERSRAEYEKLVRMCAQLYEQARQLDRAEAILVKGELFGEAALVAERRGDLERAAELLLRARDAERAAEVLRGLGKEEEAARVLGEHLRDKGESVAAAEQFRAAGECLEAGDLYRSVESYAEAAVCYQEYGDPGQAAEMYVAAGERERAGACYEAARSFDAAAECYALVGDSLREAEMLEMGGHHLRAGELHLAEDRGDQAVAAFQQVDASHGDFLEAAACLGEIFRDQQQYSLAIAKLREALTDQDLGRTTLRASYCLATALEAEGERAEAAELYEKIQALDYQHADVAERLERCRSQLAAQAESGIATTGHAQTTSGRYVIEGQLGRGGMGIVYKAKDTVLDRVVAFKVLPETLKENPQALKNFLREAKSAAQLNHPNIVTVYDAGEQDGAFYIAMEYVDGNTIKDIIRSRGPIGARGIAHVVAQMAEALAFAHDKKIVHRDIKNANAMWTRDRQAKIMDFGLAKVIEEVRNHTTVVSGTPYYMSPEQTLGKNIDHRTDIYSLGVSVFEMATGTLPFTEGNLPYHHVHTPPPDPRELKPDLPDALGNLILRCLQKDPAARYQSAREILAELRSEGSA